MEGAPSKRAVTAFIVSLASVILVCCGPVGAIAGLFAAIAAGAEVTAIDQGQAPVAGRRMAVAGIVLGIVAAVLGAVATLFWIFFLAAAQMPGARPV